MDHCGIYIHLCNIEVISIQTKLNDHFDHAACVTGFNQLLGNYIYNDKHTVTFTMQFAVQCCLSERHSTYKQRISLEQRKLDSHNNTLLGKEKASRKISKDWQLQGKNTVKEKNQVC